MSLLQQPSRRDPSSRAGPFRPSRGGSGSFATAVARLYTWAAVFVAVLVVLIVLIAANIRSVKVDWVFGSTHASLVWIVLAATVLGWLLGITTSALFRFRTRRPAD